MNEALIPGRLHQYLKKIINDIPKCKVAILIDDCTDHESLLIVQIGGIYNIDFYLFHEINYHLAQKYRLTFMTTGSSA